MKNYIEYLKTISILLDEKLHAEAINNFTNGIQLALNEYNIVKNTKCRCEKCKKPNIEVSK